MRGHIYFEGCSPNNWFESTDVAGDTVIWETSTASAYRAERILWIGYQLAMVCVVSLYILPLIVVADRLQSTTSMGVDWRLGLF